MKREVLEGLYKLIKDTGITEISLHKGVSSIIIKRNPAKIKKAVKSEPPPVEEIKEKKEEKPEKELIEVKSPTVGIFYTGKTNLAPDIAKVGMQVEKGRLLGIVDCMGTIEQVKSPCKGKLVEIKISNHKPVEYGQVLMIIEKES